MALLVLTDLCRRLGMIILALRLHSYKQQKNEKEKAAAAAAPPPPSAEASFPNEIHSSTSLGSNVAESMG
uniref:Uncharacterized protein n=1 Tax=Coccidioides posadasii RMSCC 3488 TaxID=454284 RepID=A0A0J6FE73_COCPO|nr:hypothetical protein CPAG_07733 [Coccidioides posadasii RMSCC 3488]